MRRAAFAAIATAALLAPACGESGRGGAPGEASDASPDASVGGPDASADAPAPSGDAAPDAPIGGPPRTFKVYVSGASVEQRNRFLATPFTSTGARDDHGADPNRPDEFGWMVPFADRLKLRDPGITIEWVGTDVWKGVDDATYSGTYPSTTAPKTSAQSGTDIPGWLSAIGNDDLQNKRHCYDVAIAERGGNDFPNADDALFKSQYKDLLRLLASGSSCRQDPLILVVARLPDDRNPGLTDAEYLAKMTQRYETRVLETVAELKVSDPQIHTRAIDAFTKFRNNAPSTAFPSPAWFDGTTFDYTLMHRDGKHPLRLASIYFGEVVADGVDIAELRALP